MPRSDLILILDGEMTGNGPDDELIEIGIVALEAPGWNEVSYFDAVIQPSPTGVERLLAQPRTTPIWQILRDNGLVGQVEGGEGKPPFIVDIELNSWIDSMSSAKNRSSHVPFGGSGVLHFDRKYIDKRLPDFSNRITFWAYDVAVSRRFYELAEVPWTPAYEAKTHRALDDARAHAEEFRYTLQTLRDWHRAHAAGG